jgi:kynurenine formamidase
MSSREPQGAETNWGRWGENDERGALNILDDETVLAATRTPRTGRLYQLGLPIQRTGQPVVPYRGVPQRFTLTSYNDQAMFAELGAPEETGANEDVLMFASHVSTHIDALCHVHHEGTIYNGFPKEAMTSYNGSSVCGIERAGAFATNGVLFDVAADKGVDSLPAGYAITVEDLRGALDAQGTPLPKGSVALIRTGWLERFFANGAQMSYEQPGLGLDAAKWLAANDVVAIGADNSAVECTPWDENRFLGVHIEMLVKRGIHLIEHVVLSELSADRCYAFLFAAAPLLVPGATGSPINPIAIG